uniref:Uncharacterized protein n=1 Tax=Anguilla anguilla TaxID=7936 RepID=A0A0E9XP35_ANGAN
MTTALIRTHNGALTCLQIHTKKSSTLPLRVVPSCSRSRESVSLTLRTVCKRVCGKVLRLLV